jgi:hypothetical protein
MDSHLSHFISKRYYFKVYRTTCKTPELYRVSGGKLGTPGNLGIRDISVTLRFTVIYSLLFQAVRLFDNIFRYISYNCRLFLSQVPVTVVSKFSYL